MKRGHVKIDPIIVNLVGDTKPDQAQIKKEYLFKNLHSNHLLINHVVTLIDETQLVKESMRQKFFKGPVPMVNIIA